jgi:hypothetical protein
VISKSFSPITYHLSPITAIIIPLAYPKFFGIPIMTVKSDRWIRRMAEEAQLIQPFSEQLIREAQGRRIITSGASSYGYDMRLAEDGVRVFSPIHGREVDP